ncbi:N-acetylmuramoyl-L-alanine amidase [Salipaludibacillus sp. CF4.18]|uniref:N-acetylmuramoyl-L-alanine amidase n=1 Tax=Salipaludibacillus sp. CF4.18 TaxID=3373081 RepID=UPI003EE808D1
MSKHLIIAGHGLQPNGKVDPGAHGSGTNESEFLREKFIPAMKKFAPDNMDFHTKNNFYGHQLAPSLKGYDQVTELHLDWAKNASGGHVIIYKDYSPDDIDKTIRDVVKNNVGLRSGDGFSYRSDLYNLNTFASRNITYRLIELGFINNADDMQKIKENVDEYAIQLVEAITGKEVKASSKSSKKNTRPSPSDEGRYRLRTGYFDSAEKYNSAIKELEAKYSWILHEKASHTDFNPRYRIVTGLFTGKNVAEFYAKELKKEFGWLIHIDKQ